MGQFADAARKVKRFRKRLDDEHEKATDEGMDKVQSELRRALELNDSVARGVLLTDIKRHPQHTTEAANEVISMPEWAKYLERGTGSRGDGPYPAPSNPPYPQILEWFESPRGPEPREYDTNEAAAEAVSQSIAAKGTKPHPFIGPVWDSKFGKDYIIHRNRAALTRAKHRTF